MKVTRRERGGVPFYACDGFAGAVHGFSTRLGGVSPAPWDSLNLGAARGDEAERVAENFRRFCAAAGCDSAALVKNRQVHGDRVRAVTRADIMASPDAPGVFEADALVTDVPGVCLTVFSADCIPVLLFDPVRRAAGAAHAGWRGSALGVAARTAEELCTRWGCAPEDILAAVGPGISACCFETRADVPQALRRGLGAEAEDCIRPLPGGDKFSVDLKRANVRWLLRAGLRPEHIAVCSACTACSGEEFWSHRRLGERRGSMAAVIQLTGPAAN
ncbi:MAG: peptidoglycan editing factor PgeF [Lawsonibacter sp.]|nr:peptidoglycan editing factor PgeF [Lawsonibacter sp.]